MFREQGIRRLKTLEFCAKLGSELGGQYSSLTLSPRDRQCRQAQHHNPAEAV